jgi:hypothetical protein
MSYDPVLDDEARHLDQMAEDEAQEDYEQLERETLQARFEMLITSCDNDGLNDECEANNIILLDYINDTLMEPESGTFEVLILGQDVCLHAEKIAKALTERAYK